MHPTHPSCSDCERPKTVKLHTGLATCSWCSSWANDCEARYLLSLPLGLRRAELERRIKIRGEVDRLKQAMIVIHSQRKGERNG